MSIKFTTVRKNWVCFDSRCHCLTCNTELAIIVNALIVEAKSITMILDTLEDNL